MSASHEIKEQARLFFFTGNVTQLINQKHLIGYKLHLVVDAKYELPVSYCVTKASGAESPKEHKLFKKIKEEHPEIIERCEYGIGDRGYDDGKLIVS